MFRLMSCYLKCDGDGLLFSPLFHVLYLTFINIKMCENKLQLAFQDFNLNVKDTRIVLDLKTGERKG